MNNTTKVATATAGIIAIAWLFAKRVSKNSVDEETTIYVLELPLDIPGFPENMSRRNQQLFKLILDDYRKAYAESKAQGKNVIILNPFGVDVTPCFKDAIRKYPLSES